MEKEIGKVIHWYGNINVAVVKLTGTLSVGDRVKVKHAEEVFEDSIISMQLDHADIHSGKKGQEVAVKIVGHAKEGSTLFLIS